MKRRILVAIACVLVILLSVYSYLSIVFEIRVIRAREEVRAQCELICFERQEMQKALKMLRDAGLDPEQEGVNVLTFSRHIGSLSLNPQQQKAEIVGRIAFENSLAQRYYVSEIRPAL